MIRSGKRQRRTFSIYAQKSRARGKGHKKKGQEATLGPQKKNHQKKQTAGRRTRGAGNDLVAVHEMEGKEFLDKVGGCQKKKEKEIGRKRGVDKEGKKVVGGRGGDQKKLYRSLYLSTSKKDPHKSPESERKKGDCRSSENKSHGKIGRPKKTSFRRKP